MKIEKGEWQVVSLDKDGCELGSQFFPSRKEAKTYAQRVIRDEELVASGMEKVEVRDDRGGCSADFFV